MLPTNLLRPIILNNASSLRITATAGTKFVGAYSLANVIIFTSKKTLQPTPIVKLKESFLPSSFTQHYWIRLSSIVQNSSLLAKA